MKFLIASLMFVAFGCGQTETRPPECPPPRNTNENRLLTQKVYCPGPVDKDMTRDECIQELKVPANKPAEKVQCPTCPEPAKVEQPVVVQPTGPTPEDSLLLGCLNTPEEVPQWKKEFEAGKGAEQDPIEGLRARYLATNDKYRECEDVLKEYAKNGPDLHERFPLSKAEPLDADKAMKAIVLENGKALLAAASMKGDFPSDFAGEGTTYYRHNIVDELTELFEIDGLMPEEIGTTGKKLAELRQKGIREVLMNWMKSETDGTKDVNLFGELCYQIEKKTAGGLTLDEIKALNCELLGD